MSVGGRSVSAALASSLFERAVGFIGVVLLARLLAPTEVGSFIFAAAIVTLACSFLDVGASWTLMGRPSITSSAVSAHFLLQIGPPCIVALVALVTIPFLGWPLVAAMPLILVVCLSRVIIGAATTSRLLLEREFRFHSLALASSVSAVLSLTVGLLLAWRGAGVWAMAIGAGPPSLVGALTQAVMCVAFRPIWADLHKWSWSEIRGYISTGSFLWFTWSLATQLDSILIGTFLGPATLGLYDRASRFAQSAAAVVSQSIGRVALSMYAKAGRTSLDEARQMHRHVAVGLVHVCLPMAAIFVVSGRDIVTVFLGPRWAAAGPILILLGPYFLFRVLDENLLAFLLGTLQNRTRMVGWILVAGVSVVLIPTGIWVDGPQGVAIAIALSLMVGWLWQQTAVDRAGLLVIAASALRPAIALLGAVAAGFVLASMPISVFVRLLAEVAAVAGIYVAGLVLIDRNALRQQLKFWSTWQVDSVKPALGATTESQGGFPQVDRLGDAP